MIDSGTQKTRVSTERLTRRMGKYALVVAVAKRTRELKDRHSRFGDFNTANMVGRALQEIADGKVKLLEIEETP